MKQIPASDTYSPVFRPFENKALKDCLTQGSIALIYGIGSENSAHRCFEYTMYELGWEISYTELERRFRGKPHAEGFPVEFNLSHASGAYLIGFSLNASLGVDIESNIPGEDLNALIAYAFSPDERDLLTGSDSQTFLKLWTLKEAYLKATGVGLLDALPALHAVGANVPVSAYGERGTKKQPEFRLIDPSFEGFNFICPGGETGALVSTAPISASLFGFTFNDSCT